MVGFLQGDHLFYCLKILSNTANLRLWGKLDGNIQSLTETNKEGNRTSMFS